MCTINVKGEEKRTEEGRKRRKMVERNEGGKEDIKVARKDGKRE